MTHLFPMAGQVCMDMVLLCNTSYVDQKHPGRLGVTFCEVGGNGVLLGLKR